MKTVLDECCTRLECSARLTVRTARLTARTARLPNQGGIMSHHTIQFTRVSHALVDTRFVFLFLIVYLDDSTRILFLSMYRILLFLMGRGHGGSLSERRVGGGGSTPLLACGCNALLWLGLEVPCQTTEVDGFQASLLHPFQSIMELAHFLVHLGQCC